MTARAAILKEGDTGNARWHAKFYPIVFLRGDDNGRTDAFLLPVDASRFQAGPVLQHSLSPKGCQVWQVTCAPQVE